MILSILGLWLVKSESCPRLDPSLFFSLFTFLVSNFVFFFFCFFLLSFYTCISVLSRKLRHRLALRSKRCFSQIQSFFLLLKLSSVCTFRIVLMCWYQKWFLKNKTTSLACISARKAIWKATATTLPNTL